MGRGEHARPLALLASVAVLTACGGGGTGSLALDRFVDCVSDHGFVVIDLTEDRDTAAQLSEKAAESLNTSALYAVRTDGNNAEVDIYAGEEAAKAAESVERGFAAADAGELEGSDAEEAINGRVHRHSNVVVSWEHDPTNEEILAVHRCMTNN